ncbi:hypothetical protein TrLO_g2180 [Triparma laevis f. longispina]|uniref:Uncharacterized protein n=1 Tax=Triparma laevis f. longispina TaxID=1714387 RepID=A0A9W7AV94_9STRA|nr:hypothetical protein TrLO_g2180 [Triparma laevis f. longispina]
MEMIHPKTVQRKASNLVTNEAPLFEHVPKSILTGEFFFALLLYPPVIFGANIGIELLFTWLAHNCWPISSVCECPENAADFSEDSIYYEDCIDTTSDWYTKYNAPPSNTTFTQSGWFYSESWSRENLRKVQMTQTSGEQTVAATYGCPVFRPFWAEPVDYVGVIMLVGTFFFLCWAVTSNFQTRTTLRGDRVEVEYFGGSIESVPLCKILEVEKHEAAGCAPVKEKALQIKASELVKYDSSKGKTTTTLVKPPKKEGKKAQNKILRVEPDDVDKFKELLETARGGAEEIAHFFHRETEGMNMTSDESEEGAQIFVPNVWSKRSGYWVANMAVSVAYFVCTDLGFKIFFYVLADFVQPGRPKIADEFKNSVLAFTPFTVFLLMSFLWYGYVDALNSIPTKFEVGSKAVVVVMDRANKTDIDDNYARICIPMSEIVVAEEANRWYDEENCVALHTKRFYVVEETKKLKIVGKTVAADQDKGVEVTFKRMDSFCFPSQEKREEFLQLIKLNKDAAALRVDEV